MVATRIFFYFHPLFGEDEPNLTTIFQMGWNHQPGKVLYVSQIYGDYTSPPRLGKNFYKIESLWINHTFGIYWEIIPSQIFEDYNNSMFIETIN